MVGGRSSFPRFSELSRSLLDVQYVYAEKYCCGLCGLVSGIAELSRCCRGPFAEYSMCILNRVAMEFLYFSVIPTVAMVSRTIQPPFIANGLSRLSTADAGVHLKDKYCLKITFSVFRNCSEAI